MPVASRRRDSGPDLIIRKIFHHEIFNQKIIINASGREVYCLHDAIRQFTKFEFS
jgi:hypothetical protein